MTAERTFSMIKPEPLQDGQSGEIITMIEKKGFKIIAQKRVHLNIEQTQALYVVHKERPFYNELTEYISSAQVIVQVLEKDNAIKDYRSLMGATNPADSNEGTIRHKYGKNIQCNAVHGSDAPETAAEEIAFFFAGMEIV